MLRSRGINSDRQKIMEKVSVSLPENSMIVTNETGIKVEEFQGRLAETNALRSEIGAICKLDCDCGVTAGTCQG